MVGKNGNPILGIKAISLITRRSARVQARVGDKRVHFKEPSGNTQLDREVAGGPKADLQRNYGATQLLET